MHTSETHPPAHSCGFSLIELMVMLTIAAILTAVTLPGYVYEIRKARRTDARFALLDLATREERFFSTNSTYTSNPADLGLRRSFSTDRRRRVLPAECLRSQHRSLRPQCSHCHRRRVPADRHPGRHTGE